MNRKSIIFKYIILLIGVFYLNEANGQCLNQVTHISGTSLVNGVNVTVTSQGERDTMTTYCPLYTQPYFIGYNWSSGISNDGSYTFVFTPPIDSLSLNFSGIGVIGNPSAHQEIIKLIINGNHYAIPSVGDSNGCDPLALLTANGNLTGYGGMKDLTIPGPINSITILDSVVSGAPVGALFSLFICNSTLTDILDYEANKLSVFPNPADELLTITGIDILNAKLIMKNIFGQNIIIDPIIQSDHILIDISNLSVGIYFVIIENGGIIETIKVIIK
ncbi:T9SS type A sorting domain-containing protein [Crocinitomicaceae bacterium]|nr:T9SS type A sorting domain-containing protein [Crocinitomicaceae bacterium]